MRFFQSFITLKKQLVFSFLRLYLCLSFSLASFIVRSLFVHCSFIVRSLFVFCSFIVRSLFVFCSSFVRSLFVHSLFVFSLSACRATTARAARTVICLFILFLKIGVFHHLSNSERREQEVS